MQEFEFIKALSGLRANATFLSVNGYKNESDEVADYNIVFHISYKNAIEKSLAILEPLETTNELEATAKQELINSLKKSLADMEEVPVEAVDDTYTHITNDNGTYIKGIKIHNATNTLHLYGLVVSKKVIAEGNYKNKNRRPLTVVKDNMKRLLPISKFRQFKIVPGRVENISVEKLTLLPPDSLI